uniref:Nitroreductase domain-containing protein n=1 Tax=Chromera velia CCMP2878 TaxID=1169474 RepID=A0A0G4GSD3_9ALVE|mmetsp:Transcript_20283/g.40622  ORF Transcript_20283/g.40622 Transcript_20283/m.40622 type:complete len:248 (+) Transcript_20283:287-1030(+)|eukprot:Cvel_5137.t1-p1 / transcript=Cvel_5137.t1 / gene=Cvel_5137 / organism=Chromera_velia_CCMP2878 / gene_product=hypothetical protein / transcript_product=hypothetical protein / location=Cvel_scaffold235:49517-50257(-) / protein_length=247 / sequence_SO=supercontig / SO=protein_coding / is_pseudo=false
MVKDAHEKGLLSVSEALRNRRSVRAFLDKRVDQQLLLSLISRASQAPSGGNLQPWKVYVVHGETTAVLVGHIQSRIGAGKMPSGSEYHIYPPDMKEMKVHNRRRVEVARGMYALLGVERDDHEGKMKELHRNWTFFGAPAGLILTIDERMQQGQWADVGMFLLAFCLLCEESGLQTCCQEAWAMYSQELKDVLNIPQGETVFAGCSVGYADWDHPVNSLRTERASLRDFASVPTAEEMRQRIANSKL